MGMKSAILPTIIGLCFLLLLGCEAPTLVEIGNGPSFSLSGSGHLSSFTVYAPQAGHRIATPNDAKSETWSIQAAKGSSEGSLIAHMHLEYGRVPQGYVQTMPRIGSADTLNTGFVYYFFAETTGAPGKGGFFYLAKAGPILINVPGLCESGFVGDVRAVKCGTDQPFVEPDSLEQFVKQNRVQQ